MRPLALLVALLSVAVASAWAQAAREEIYPGNGKDGFTLVITGDGWTDADLKTVWPAKVKSVIDKLWSIDPYGYFKHAFRIIRLDVASASHGCAYADPPKYFRKDLGFETDGSGNVTKTPDGWTEDSRKELMAPKRSTHYGLVWPATGSAPAVTAAVREKLKADLGDIQTEVVVIITPDEEINNGVADPGHPQVIVMNTIDEADMGDFVGTIAHELGHAFFFLGDEYGGNNSRPSRLYFKNVEFDGDVSSVQWKHLVQSAFPGGGGCSSMWHPTQSCRMSADHPYKDRFCVVCLQAMSERVSASFRLIESTDPSGTVLPKYTALGSMNFKVKLRGSGSSNYAISWIFDGKNLGAGTVTPGASGPTAEFTLKAPPLMFGVHKMTFLVEERHNFVKANPTPGQTPSDKIEKVPQSKDWWITVIPAVPILPIPGIDWSW